LPDSRKNDPDFPADEARLWRKLREVNGFTPQTAEDFCNWEAVYGEIESPNRLSQERGGRGYSGNGYGANGTVPAQIKVTQTKILVHGRWPAIKVSMPLLPDPPVISNQIPSVPIPDVLLTFLVPPARLASNRRSCAPSLKGVLFLVASEMGLSEKWILRFDRAWNPALYQTIKYVITL